MHIAVIPDQAKGQRRPTRVRTAEQPIAGLRPKQDREYCLRCGLAGGAPLGEV